MNGRNNGNRNENDGNGNDGGSSWWQTAAAVAAVAAGTASVVGGLGYLLTKGSTTSRVSQASSQTEEQEQSEILQHDVPSRPVISNLNSLLADIDERYIALKKEDFQRHFRVFDEVFRQLHEKMKAVDKNYQRYASVVQFNSSHDRLRVNKPDEFDVDIVIGVPDNLNSDPINPEESDIVFEQKCPGFVQLRAGTQYQKILAGDGQDCLINKTAHEWLDDKNYILRSKFIDWFKSVGNRGLERFPKPDPYGLIYNIYVDGVRYTIRTTSRGPAWTIIIESDGFRLKVDLVPALKFPETRWLRGAYREIPLECRKEYWMVDPKLSITGQTPHDEQRFWRVALQDQEKRLLNDTYNLRQTIRLLKKLRDARGMKGIANYDITTLFFWEVLEKKNIDPTFWQRSDIATLFKHMLQKFYESLEKQNIPYFWNKNYNMIENLNTDLVNEYKRELIDLLKLLQNPCDYKLVARYLLTSKEYQEYQQFL